MSQFQDMVSLLQSAYEDREDIVVCLLGPVGIGKTAAVRQHAKKIGADVVTIVASQILPTEVSGITIPDSETKAMEIYDHFRLGHLKDGDVLFFDELLEADQCVLSACLTLIESRMMMSGRMLPDIQIVAASNRTTPATSLKESIRQRFMWAEYGIDQQQVRDYILKRTGIKVPDHILSKVTGTGNDYNILSPRSLTKICEWIKRSPTLETANHINNIWKSNIGSTIFDIYNTMSAETKVRVKLCEIVPEMEDRFMNTSFSEIVELIKHLDIEDQLKDIYI